MTTGALDGLRVLDLSRVLAGPYCTMLLGDMGADVIKVESPARGDDTRHWGPPWAGGESAYFLSVNRNKRSLAVNIKHPEGQNILQKLAATSDILVENFRVGGLKKYNLDYASLKELQPALIYCSLTGYGQSGPHAGRAGYDFVVQAEGGIMSITGPVEGPPSKVGVAIVDIMAGMFAATSILAALHHRSQSGVGQHIDISLLDSQVGWLANVAQNYLVSDKPPKRYGNAHANIVPYQVFETLDGHIAVGIGNDRQFRAFCEAAGCMEIWDDERYHTNPGRVKNRDDLIAALQPVFCAQPNRYWLELLLKLGIPGSPINAIPEVFNDPQVIARDMLQTIAHPSAGELRLVGPVPKLSVTPAKINRPPPRHGEHNHEVLSERLGFTERQIANLLSEGVIGPNPSQRIKDAQGL